MAEWPPKNRFSFYDALVCGDLDRLNIYDVPDEIVDKCLSMVIMGMHYFLDTTIYNVFDLDGCLRRNYQDVVDHLLLNRKANMKSALFRFGVSDYVSLYSPEIIRALHHELRFLDVEEDLNA